MALTRVDLPAPLSPTRATTSWELTSKSMPLRACTAPKRLEIPRSESTAVLVGAGGGEVVAVMRVLGSGRSDTGEGGTGEGSCSTPRGCRAVVVEVTGTTPGGRARGPPTRSTPVWSRATVLSRRSADAG